MNTIVIPAGEVVVGDTIETSSGWAAVNGVHPRTNCVVLDLCFHGGQEGEYGYTRTETVVVKR